MAKVYSWAVSDRAYAYIVNPSNTSEAYVGAELKGSRLEIVSQWAQDATDTEYDAQFNKMVQLVKNKGYDVKFESAEAYRTVSTSCDNLRGPAGRGIVTIKHDRDDGQLTWYKVIYTDETEDEFYVKNGKDGENGLPGEPGTPADKGVSSRFFMIYTSGVDSDGELFTPNRPEGGSYNFDTFTFTCPDGWTRSDSSLKPPVWMSSRTFCDSELSSDPYWSDPIQISGDNGEAGTDGISTEFIYKLTDIELTYADIANMPSENVSDYIPDPSWGWKDSPEGVDEDNKTEWYCIRKFDKETKIWGKWEGPYIWSRYGSNGQDGDGVQYIFFKNKGELPNNPTPANWDSDEKYQDKHTEWIPTEGDYYNFKGQLVENTALEEQVEGKAPAGLWTDDPADVDSSFQYVWVSSRKFRALNGETEKKWQRYSDPTLWAKFGQDGKPGTAIRKLYALSDSTGDAPDLPTDSVFTADWGTGFPVDYVAGENVVWGTEAEIYLDTLEFVYAYKIASGKDENGNVLPPADAAGNSIEVSFLPREEDTTAKYLIYQEAYYSWQGGWCKPYLVTGVKGEPSTPVDYNTYVFAYGYMDSTPNPPSSLDALNPGQSQDGNGRWVTWLDYPDTTIDIDGDGTEDLAIDGKIDAAGLERRWYQCIGQVDQHTGQIKEKGWGAVMPCYPRDGETKTGPYTEFRFGVTENRVKPALIDKDTENGGILREPKLYNSKNEEWGWYRTDKELPEVPAGGAMWMIWATINPDGDVEVVDDAGWNGPQVVSGEQGETGAQGPAGKRGTTGLPGATSNQMYCLGTYGKDTESEYFWEAGDGYFGGKGWEQDLLPEEMRKQGWFSGKEMPYADCYDVYSQAELDTIMSNDNYIGRVIRFTTTTTPEGSSIPVNTYSYYLKDAKNEYRIVRQNLTEEENAEFQIHIWCIQGNDIWKKGKEGEYIRLDKKPSDATDDNTLVWEEETLPEDKRVNYRYLQFAGEYYTWDAFDGDVIEHTKVGVDWTNPFKLQGTNGLRGLSGSRGQVVYPMGIYNPEEVYVTTELKAPYVYDPEDSLYYVYNTVGIPWVGKLPDNYKSIKTEDGKYKYSIDGSGKEGTWMGDNNGQTPSSNFAWAEDNNLTPGWVRFESFQALYTSIGIIENGMIGSAVYNNEFMFSQQGIDRNGNKSDYAAEAKKAYESGFLSAYEFDETKKQWKYAGTAHYIEDRKVNPYERKTEDNKNLVNSSLAMGDYIHSFMPNVCINFATGEMWTSAGKTNFDATGAGYLAGQNINWTSEGTLIIGNPNEDAQGIIFEDGKMTIGPLDGYKTTVDGLIKAVNTRVDGLSSDLKGLTNSIDDQYEDFQDLLNQGLAKLKQQVDQKAETFYQDTDPSLQWTTDQKKEHEGDMWYNTATAITATNKYEPHATFRWDGSKWNKQDIPLSVFDRIDGKASVYIDKPDDDIDGDGYLYLVRDMWFLERDYTSTNELGPTAKTGSIWVSTQNRLVSEGFRHSDWVKKGTELDNWIDKEFKGIIGELQTDDIIHTHYGPDDPSSAWHDDITSEASTYAGNHLSDLWFRTVDNKAYVFTNTTTTSSINSKVNDYYWTPSEAEIPEGLFDKYDGKSAIFVAIPDTDDDGDGYLYYKNDAWILEKDYQNEKTGAKKGTIWVSKNDRKHADGFKWGDWSAAASELQDWVDNEFSDLVGDILANQPDGELQTHYGPSDPSNKTGEQWQSTNKNEVATYAEYHLGDLWFNTTNNKSYVYSKTTDNVAEYLPAKPEGYYWVIAENLPDELWDRIDGKSTIFTKKPEDDHDGDGYLYKEGDFWLDEGEIYRSTTNRITTDGFKRGDWIPASKYTDDTVAQQALARFEAIGDDNYVDKDEQKRLKDEGAKIKKEYNGLVAQSKKYGLTATTHTSNTIYKNYTNAYDRFSKTIAYYTNSANIITDKTSPYYQSIPIISKLTGTTGSYYGNLAAYYDPAQNLQNALVSAVAKTEAANIDTSGSAGAEQAKNDLAKALGYGSYDEMVDFAKNSGMTITEGGFIKTSVIQSDFIDTVVLQAETAVTKTLLADQAWVKDLSVQKLNTVPDTGTTMNRIIIEGNTIDVYNAEKDYDEVLKISGKNKPTLKQPISEKTTGKTLFDHSIQGDGGDNRLYNTYILGTFKTGTNKACKYRAIPVSVYTSQYYLDFKGTRVEDPYSWAAIEGDLKIYVRQKGTEGDLGTLYHATANASAGDDQVQGSYGSPPFEIHGSQLLYSGSGTSNLEPDTTYEVVAYDDVHNYGWLSLTGTSYVSALEFKVEEVYNRLDIGANGFRYTVTSESYFDVTKDMNQNTVAFDIQFDSNYGLTMNNTGIIFKFKGTKYKAQTGTSDTLVFKKV